MEQTLDIPHRVAGAMTTLARCSPKQHGIAIVMPLREGMREVAAEFLAEGPPSTPRGSASRGTSSSSPTPRSSSCSRPRVS